jgi:hypothetical protein
MLPSHSRASRDPWLYMIRDLVVYVLLAGLKDKVFNASVSPCAVASRYHSLIAALYDVILWQMGHNISVSL